MISNIIFKNFNFFIVSLFTFVLIGCQNPPLEYNLNDLPPIPHINNPHQLVKSEPKLVNYLILIKKIQKNLI